MKPIHVLGNTYVLDLPILHIPYYKLDEERIILLDTGLKNEHRVLLETFLDEEHLQVAGILCTHAHIDHVGNAAYLKEKYQCPVAMPRKDADIVASLLNLKIFFSGFPMERTKEHFGHMLVKTDLFIEEGDETVTIAGVTFQVHHTPGHSPSHISITTPDQVTYLGDALISEEVMDSAKLPYAHVLTKDLASKIKLYQLRSAYYILAHKGIYPDIKDLITDNLYFYKNRAEEILSCIQEPLTFEEILARVTETMHIHLTSPNKYLAVHRMLRCYMDYLEDTGKLSLLMDNAALKYTRTSPSV